VRIAFICGGAEPGADGVGDYTRELASECARQGHPSAVASLNDIAVRNPIQQETPLATLRLPATLPWMERGKMLASFLSAFRPDIASLQFVPYAYDSRGFPWALPRALGAARNGAPFHLLVHETWLAATGQSGMKERLVGVVQRALFKRLLSTLRPIQAHTTIPAYQRLLKQVALEAKLLPIFGNIPVAANPREEWFQGVLERAGIASGRRAEIWVFVIFGALHPVWPPEPLFTHLKAAAGAAGKRILIVCVGRIGPGAELWTELAQKYSPELTFVLLGAQSAEHISTLLSMGDFGIATSPWALLGKSGSVAAMVEHGLPVIVNRDDVHFAGFDHARSGSPLLIPLTESLPADLLKATRGIPHRRLPEIATLFLDDLAAALRPGAASSLRPL